MTPRAVGEVGMSEEQLEAIRERAEKATPGPWAWAQTADKGYGASVGAGCYAEDDEESESPLSGNLTERTDDYYVDDGIAELDGQSAAANAHFIAHARDDIPALLAHIQQLRAALAARDKERAKVNAKLLELYGVSIDAIL